MPLTSPCSQAAPLTCVCLGSLKKIKALASHIILWFPFSWTRALTSVNKDLQNRVYDGFRVFNWSEKESRNTSVFTVCLSCCISSFSVFLFDVKYRSGNTQTSVFLRLTDRSISYVHFMPCALEGTKIPDSFYWAPSLFPGFLARKPTADLLATSPTDLMGLGTHAKSTTFFYYLNLTPVTISL